MDVNHAQILLQPVANQHTSTVHQVAAWGHGGTRACEHKIPFCASMTCSSSNIRQLPVDDSGAPATNRCLPFSPHRSLRYTCLTVVRWWWEVLGSRSPGWSPLRRDTTNQGIVDATQDYQLEGSSPPFAGSSKTHFVRRSALVTKLFSCLWHKRMGG